MAARHGPIRRAASAVPLLLTLGTLPAVGAPPSPASESAGSSSENGLVGVTVVFENLSPANGTWLTPVWVGFHDGVFDAFDTGSPATTALERLAEDGNPDPLAGLFASAGAGAAQGVLPADGGDPRIAPGETATRTFVIDSAEPENRFLSWAAMVIPSNDAFLGNDDPQAHRIFDAGGSFVGGYVTVDGGDVLDAGTEVNDELPEHTAFFGQSAADSGIDENGVVHVHPGYDPPGAGGILDDPMFSDADFTEPDYEVARITIFRSDTIVAGGTVSGTWEASGSPYVVQGDVTVPVGETLVIEPGVIIYADAGVGITVRGDLQAVGTAEDPILFTGPKDGFPDGVGWQGIRFEAGPSTSRLEHCTVEYGDRSSTYESGGGLACVDTILEIRHSTLRRNRASLEGAAVFCTGSTLLIDDSEISDNRISGTNSGEGAGVYCEDCTVEITASRIHDNRIATFDPFGATNSRGGGIALRDSDGLVADTLVYRNSLNHSGTEAESAGGGIYVNGGGPVLRGNTVWGNEVHYTNHLGGGIYLQGYDAQLVDNIVAGNVGCGIWFAPGASTSQVAYNDLHGNTEGAFDGGYIPAGLGVISQTNANGDPCDDHFNILLDPLMVSPQTGDFRLQPESPCVDAGDPDSPPDPDGSVADIGAIPLAGPGPVFADGFESGDTAAWSSTSG